MDKRNDDIIAVEVLPEGTQLPTVLQPNGQQIRNYFEWFAPQKPARSPLQFGPSNKGVNNAIITWGNALGDSEYLVGFFNREGQTVLPSIRTHHNGAIINLSPLTYRLGETVLMTVSTLKPDGTWEVIHEGMFIVPLIERDFSVDKMRFKVRRRRLLVSRLMIVLPFILCAVVGAAAYYLAKKYR